MRKFDPTKPVRTRDGRKARILAHDLKGTYSIAFAYPSTDGKRELIATARADGRFYAREGDGLDLINEPEKRTLYVNIWETANDDIVIAYKDKKQALNYGGADSIGATLVAVAVPLKYTVGEWG